MRTLFISNLVPWPLDTGAKIRIHHILRAVAEVSEVTLVCFANNGAKEDENLERVRTIVKECHPIPRESCRYHQSAQLPRLRRRIRAVLEMSHFSRPSLLSSWRSDAAVRLIHELRERKFDLVWGEHLGSAILLREF